ALQQLKYSKHFVQRFFRRILKLLAHAHDQRGISEGYDFHQFRHSERSRGIPWHNPQLISRGPSTSPAYAGSAQDDRALNIARHTSHGFTLRASLQSQY